MGEVTIDELRAEGIWDRDCLCVHELDHLRRSVKRCMDAGAIGQCPGCGEYGPPEASGSLCIGVPSGMHRQCYYRSATLEGDSSGKEPSDG